MNKYYVGSCQDLDKRFEDHITMKYFNSFTAKVNDWELIQQIENLQYPQARKIEIHIKKMKSKTYIKNLHKYPELLLNLINQYSKNNLI